MDLDAIRREAHNLLSKSNAYDAYPTPVWQIVEGAGLRIDDALFTERIDHLVNSVDPKLVRRATDKLLGMVDTKSGVIYVSPFVSLNDPAPLVLHETGHFWLPWQRELYCLIQDSHSSLFYDLRDQFEREATRFAWELVFQVDRFQRDAEGSEFSLRTPVNLARRYGATPYAAIRRFVETNRRPCAVVIRRRSNGDGSSQPAGPRLIRSETFAQQFGDQPSRLLLRQAECGIVLPDSFYRARFQLDLVDCEDRMIECEAHSINIGINDFTFIYPAGSISAVRF